MEEQPKNEDTEPHPADRILYEIARNRQLRDRILELRNRRRVAMMEFDYIDDIRKLDAIGRKVTERAAQILEESYCRIPSTD